MITLVVPFLDAFDKLERCLETALQNAGTPINLVLIDNGSKKEFMFERATYIRNEKNTGVLPTYKQGFQHAKLGDIVCFIHSDVLLHEEGWAIKVENAFENDAELGLLGLFGARGIGQDGGRAWSMGNMAGKEWGACPCHDLAAWHHGEPIGEIQPAVVLDGVGMFFRYKVLDELINKTDAFASWRAPHHFYDKILSLKVIKLGYHVAVVDVWFDHFSGATANHSKTYDKTMTKWAKKHNFYLEGEEGDRMVYLAAEQQMFEEFRNKFPVNVVGDYHYEWNS